MTRLHQISHASRATRRGAVLLTAGTLVAAALAAGMPAASAATAAGWRLVRTSHYGPRRNESGYDAVLAHSTDAWFFGGTNLKRTGRPVAEQWVSNGWRRAVLPSGLTSWIVAASAAKPTNIWAVSHLGGYVLDWSQGIWAAAPGWTPLPGQRMTGISAITAKNVWVFGASSGTAQGTGTWHDVSGTWTQVSGIASGIFRASDLGANSIWAIGGINGSLNAVEHYDGATNTWTQVTASALAGVRFSAVLAQTADSVWVAGRVRQKGRDRPKLAHWNGKHWVRIAVPGRAIPSQISSDGKGGIWVITNSARGSWLRHRTLHGQWRRRDKIGSSPATQISAIAHIPGTNAFWGGGRVKAGSGTDAAIYTRGKIG